MVKFNMSINRIVSLMYTGCAAAALISAGIWTATEIPGYSVIMAALAAVSVALAMHYFDLKDDVPENDEC